MSILDILFLIVPCGFVYLILALQVSSSFPPFYEKVNDQEEMLALWPFMFAIFVTLATSVFATVFVSDSFQYLSILFGALSIWTGVRVRNSVQRRTDGPLNWLLNPLTIGVMNRWPMLLFDVWTIGLTALLGLVIVI